MALDESTVTRLHGAATAGDVRSAYALARLLCLTAVDPDSSTDFEVQTWPEEPWLRAVLDARPSDVPTMTLLAGRLIQQFHHWRNTLDLNPDAAEEHGEDETALQRRQTEAAALLGRIRTASPENHGSGLAALAGLIEYPWTSPDHETAYSFYVLDDTAESGSSAHCVTIVTSDPDELRWSCDRWCTLVEGCGLSEEPTLTTYLHGEEAGVVDLADYFDGTLRWGAVPLPSLVGEALPPGLPVPGRELFYGFASRVE